MRACAVATHQRRDARCASSPGTRERRRGDRRRMPAAARRSPRAASTPFIATSTPSGARCRDASCAKLRRSENAREITTSNGASATKSSTRDATARTLAQRELDRGLRQERRSSCDSRRAARPSSPAARSRAGCRERRRRRPTSSTRRCCARRQIRQHGQRVEQMVRDHPRGLADRRQVVRPVPLREQLEVRVELVCARSGRRVDAERGAACGDARRRSHALVAAVMPTRTRVGAAALAARNPRFRCTSSSEIAAGVTPEMRAAWPIVSGSCAFSFCCTSIDRPRTIAVVEVRRQSAWPRTSSCRAISTCCRSM